MLYLLPEEEKIIIKREYILRLFSVFVFSAIIIVFVCFILILPTYFVSKSNLLPFENKEATSNKTPKNSMEDYSLFLKDIRSDMDRLMLVGKIENPAEIISSAVFSKNKLISIQKFYYEKSENKEILNIFGTALTRDALVAYEKKLQENDFFEKVSLPVSDLAQNKNIDFSISLSVKTKK